MAKTINKGSIKNDLPDNKQDKGKLKPGAISAVKDKEDPDDNDLLNGDSDVSKEEALLLERSADSQAGPEDVAWNEATLDNVDEDGEPLNEENEFSGKDLDVPGSEEDDSNEEVGAEDEENNSYSIGGDKKD